MRGDGAAAEAVYAANIAALDQAPGGSAVSLVQALDGLARLRWAQGQRAAVEPLLRREIDLCAQHFAPDHPQLAPALDLLAELQAATDRPAEAQATLARAAAIRALPR